MFYYYGAKSRLASNYPPPRFDVILEPFAGSAGYSMHWLSRVPSMRAILVESDPEIFDVWSRILRMDPDEIRGVHVPEVGSRTADRLVMLAAASNAVAVSSGLTVTERIHREANRMLRRIARLRRMTDGRVEVIRGDYSSAPDIPATWFIDPPYAPKATDAKTSRPGGRGYAPGHCSDDLDYAALAEWCTSRIGQVIVCEQLGAEWLPFRPVTAMTDTVGKLRTEVVWTSDPDRQLAFGWE